jgi:hypothetical protein
LLPGRKNIFEGARIYTGQIPDEILKQKLNYTLDNVFLNIVFTEDGIKKCG